MYLKKNAWDSHYTLKFKQKYKSQALQITGTNKYQKYFLIVLKYEELLISRKW